MERAARILSLVIIFAVPVGLAGECREEPAVQMDERAAESHLLAKKNPELPPERLRLIRAQRVVVRVTVDREGVICDARAIRGPEDLRQPAERAVRKHWKFRPFLVNRKPVVAQFPVTVDFVRPGTDPPLKAELWRRSATASSSRANGGGTTLRASIIEHEISR